MDKSRITKLADEILEGRKAAKASTSNSITTQYWIGIAGAPGSGKSTLVHDLVNELQSRSVTCVGVPMDGYHYSRAELDSFADPIAAHRFRGAPFTFNGSKFVEDLRMAKMEGKFSFPGFDHAAKDPAPTAASGGAGVAVTAKDQMNNCELRISVAGRPRTDRREMFRQKIRR